MPTIFYPAQNFESKNVSVNGTNIKVSSDIINPYIIFKVGNVGYPNGLVVEYAGGFRRFYASVDSARNIFITCYTIAYGQDIPAFNIGDIEIFVAGQPGTLTVTPPAAVSFANAPSIASVLQQGQQVYRLNSSWFPVPDTKIYRVFGKQGNTWIELTTYLPTDVNSAGVIISNIYFDGVIPLYYDPTKLLDFKVVTVGYDDEQYGITTVVLAPTQVSSNTGTFVYQSNYYVWLDDRGDGIYFGSTIVWEGQNIVQGIEISGETYSINGFTYTKGPNVFSSNEGYSGYQIKRTPI